MLQLVSHLLWRVAMQVPISSANVHQESESKMLAPLKVASRRAAEDGYTY